MSERLMLRDLADSLLLANIEHLRPEPEPVEPTPTQPEDPAAVHARVMALIQASRERQRNAERRIHDKENTR